MRIVEEVQIIAIFGHMHNVLAMQGVAGRLVANVARSVIVVHAGLLGAQAVFVVIVGDLIVAGFTKVPLMRSAHLAAIPGVVPGAVVQRVADRVIGNGLVVECSHFFFPVGVAIGKEIRLYSRTNGASSKCIRDFALNIAAQIIGIQPSSARSIGSGVMRVVHSGQLAQQIVLVGDGLGAVADAGDVARIVIGIGQRSAGLGNGLHQRRGAIGAVTASQISVGRGNPGAAGVDRATGDAPQTVIDIRHLTGAAEVEQRRPVLIVMGEDRNSGATVEAPPMLG